MIPSTSVIFVEGDHDERSGREEGHASREEGVEIQSCEGDAFVVAIVVDVGCVEGELRKST